MKMPVHPFRDFFQRAKEKRDITKAEKMASEFQGCDVFMGGAGNDTIEQLCAIGPSALPSLLSILISSKPVRITDDLLASISLMRTPETLSMLLATLSSQDNPLRGSACIVLGFWKEKSAVEALASIALDASEPMPIRINAVHSLGRIGDSSATAPLLSLVTPYECSLATRNAPVLISTNYSPSKHGDVDGKGGDELIQACIEALAELVPHAVA